MKDWVIFVSLSILVIGLGQKGLKAQPLDDIKEIKKEFRQYLGQERPIVGSVLKKAIKDREKDLDRRWAATSWHKSRDRIKESAPWNKKYGWQPSDNLPPLEPAASATTTTTGAGGGGVGGGKKR